MPTNCSRGIPDISSRLELAKMIAWHSSVMSTPSFRLSKMPSICSSQSGCSTSTDIPLPATAHDAYLTRIECTIKMDLALNTGLDSGACRKAARFCEVKWARGTYYRWRYHQIRGKGPDGGPCGDSIPNGQRHNDCNTTAPGPAGRPDVWIGVSGAPRSTRYPDPPGARVRRHRMCPRIQAVPDSAELSRIYRTSLYRAARQIPQEHADQGRDRALVGSRPAHQRGRLLAAAAEVGAAGVSSQPNHRIRRNDG